jgi:hypothetical protein
MESHFSAYQFLPGSAEATRADVRCWRNSGLDEIKVHRRLPRDWYFAAIDESTKQNIRLVGHTPMEITPEEASNAGQYMIEHTEILFEGTFQWSWQTPSCPMPFIHGSTPISQTSDSRL